ncbi:hypothetical protein PGRAN_02680 [Listeria grandensis FSL F6-0971]|uniref:Uncharacterized protein n=1 Tax=Listeria grandensis FSL F6-0971 TaxID=1265819 RepID=W7BJ25_9LIST|nr:hypothetical protein [Listeria grandensis]EUJ24765.1 hypothetical protein PGRAN_02680 [Listeria grandensis FSL F6-0971]
MAEEKKNTATKKDIEAVQAKQSIPEAEKNPMGKFGVKETFEGPDGTEYTFQFPGTRAAQDIIDQSKNGYGVVVESAYNEALWKSVIVSPQGINWDYWDEMPNRGYRDVMNAADNFLGRWIN